jgi:uncharacterized protein YgbK (DUF1537 family)
VRRAGAAAERALAADVRAIYRKIDSTLRGHVGPEIAETLRTIAARAKTAPVALVAPAFPTLGRTTLGGEVLVRGVPLAETETWRDARMQVSARPAELLARAGLRARVVPLEAVRAGTEALVRTVERLADEGADALVFDAEVEEDLALLARAGAALARPVLWSGSSGLARHLPGALGLKGRGPSAIRTRPERAGAVVVLVGSRSSIAREQARVLAGEPGVTLVELDARGLLAGPGHPRWPAEALARALAPGGDVVAVVGEEPLGLERGPAIAAAAARLVAEHAPTLRGLVATGGDVARALLGALGATGLHLVGEVEPAVPIGVTDSSPPHLVVTKAGAFGDPHTLSRSRAALRGAQGGPVR